MKQKGFAEIFLIIVVVIGGLGALGYFAYKNGQINLNSVGNNLPISPKPTSEISSAPTRAASASPTNTQQRTEFQTYTNNLIGFQIDYPKGMTVEENLTTDHDNPENKGVRVVFKNDEEELIVSTDFMGGWGGSPCIENSDKQVSGFKTAILLFKKETGSTPLCENVYIDLVALVNDEDFNHPYPILIELKPLGNKSYPNKQLFEQILNSFRLKK